jgi:MYXO-CTERM domain-containing protein
MQRSFIRHFFQSTALVATLAIANAAAPSVVTAQGTGDAAGSQTTTSRTDDRDRGMDLGWLGLLGLAGLLGLRRRDNHVNHDPTRRP